MISWIINFLHLLLVFGLVISIFVPNKDYKIICLVLLTYILFQYLTNYGRCGLTEIEYLFKREKYKEGFLYRLIKPVITLPEKYFDKYLYIIHIFWIISLGIQIYL
jgi:hypothetical protein